MFEFTKTRRKSVEMYNKKRYINDARLQHMLQKRVFCKILLFV